MRLVSGIIISMLLMGSMGHAQEVSVGDDRSATEPVTFNISKKTPAELSALIDNLLAEPSTQISTTESNSNTTHLSSESGAK